MTEDTEPDGAEASTVAPADAAGEVEAYETDVGVVLYDARNPLAWIESRSPVRLDDAT